MLIYRKKEILTSTLINKIYPLPFANGRKRISLKKKKGVFILRDFKTENEPSKTKGCCSPHQCFRFQFPSAFFQGPADLCGSFCYEVLKCCNHRSRSTQTEASALLYFFMRKNFEFNKQKSIVRSHLQVSAPRCH